MTAGILFAVGVPSGFASAEDLERGREIYGLCSQCHGDAGAGNKLFLAPAIAGLDQWYVELQLGYFRSGVRGLHPDDVAGMRMAPMSRTLKDDADLKAVAAYVASLPVVTPEATLEGGNPENGKTSFALCATCHGPEAAGNQQMFAPPLRNRSDWYLKTSIEKFKAGIRGSNPGNPNASVMRGMSMTLADDQAVIDVITYITTLAR